MHSPSNKTAIGALIVTCLAVVLVAAGGGGNKIEVYSLHMTWSQGVPPVLGEVGDVRSAIAFSNSQSGSLEVHAKRTFTGPIWRLGRGAPRADDGTAGVLEPVDTGDLGEYLLSYGPLSKGDQKLLRKGMLFVEVVSEEGGQVTGRLRGQLIPTRVKYKIK